MEVRPKSLIKEVLLYAAGYRIALECNLTENSDNEAIPKVSSQVVDKGIRFFAEFIKQYPKSIHADDAAYYLSKLLIKKGKYEVAASILLDIEKFGNEDFEYPAQELYLSILGKLGNKNITTFLNKEFKPKNQFKKAIIEKIVLSKSDKDVLKSIENISESELKIHGYFLLSDKIIQNFRFQEALKYANQALYILSRSGISIDKNEYNYYNQSLLDIVYKCQAMQDLNSKKYHSIDDFHKLAIDFRRKKFDYLLSEFVIKKGLVYAKANKIPYDYLLYLYILIYKERDFAEVEIIINEYLQKFPKSRYLDDALAEVIYSASYVFENTEKAEYYFSKLITFYSSGNAVDNSYDWIASIYFQNCQYCYESDVEKCVLERKKSCERAKKLYLELITKYPYTRFARSGTDNLIEINRILPKIESECKEMNTYYEDNEN
jgi:outer membrane protein assembly factor BamD (BamD/ComL family)